LHFGDLPEEEIRPPTSTLAPDFPNGGGGFRSFGFIDRFACRVKNVEKAGGWL
jgi:hypothetical protein